MAGTGSTVFTGAAAFTGSTVFTGAAVFTGSARFGTSLGFTGSAWFTSSEDFLVFADEARNGEGVRLTESMESRGDLRVAPMCQFGVE